MGGLFQRLGDDERDRLAVELHLRLLQHMQLLARLGVHLRSLLHLLVGQARRVLVGQHREHARRALGRDRVDPADPAARDGAERIAAWARPGRSNSAA